MEKTVKSILIAVWIVCCIAEASANADEMDGCIDSIHVRTCADLKALQAAECVNGDVWVKGQLRLCNRNLTTLSMPLLEYVTGSIIIMGNPRLVNIAAPLLTEAYGVIVQNNPILPQCRAVDVGIQTGAKTADRYTGQLNQGECEYE